VSGIALLGIEGEEAFIDRVFSDATEDINILLAGEAVNAIGGWSLMSKAQSSDGRKR